MVDLEVAFGHRWDRAAISAVFRPTFGGARIGDTRALALHAIVAVGGALYFTRRVAGTAFVVVSPSLQIVGPTPSFDGFAGAGVGVLVRFGTDGQRDPR